MEAAISCLCFDGLMDIFLFRAVCGPDSYLAARLCVDGMRFGYLRGWVRSEMCPERGRRASWNDAGVTVVKVRRVAGRIVGLGSGYGWWGGRWKGEVAVGV